LFATVAATWLITFTNAQKIAIIGGGISGTFTAKYLTDYDAPVCKIESIHIYDPNPIMIGQRQQQQQQQQQQEEEETLQVVHDEEENPSVSVIPPPNDKDDDDGDDDHDWQGSRVAAVRLKDGRIVEIGASIFHEANTLLKTMIANDPSLELGKPFQTGRVAAVETTNNIPTAAAATTREGLGIYHGNGIWKFISNKTKPFNTFWTLVRYNMDLYKVDRWTTRAQERFQKIPALLESQNNDTFFETPDDMWKAVNLLKPVHASFEQLLDTIGVSASDYWLNSVVPYQGSIRQELLTAINLINYNQGNAQVNGLVGLASFAASKGPLYSVVGGNYQIIQSAFQQAVNNSHTNCQKKEEGGGGGGDVDDVIQHKQQKVTTVIGSMTGFELFSGTELLGTYDTVVLAAPLQQSRIQFMIPSDWDGAVLHPMPLAGGHVDTDDDEERPMDTHTTTAHEGHPINTGQVPSCASNPFTQVVTTVISHGTLDHEYFQILEEPQLPRAVCMTEQGKYLESNITAITEIAEDGLYKIFSSNVLEKDVLFRLFGPNHKVEYTKVKSYYGYTRFVVECIERVAKESQVNMMHFHVSPTSYFFVAFNIVITIIITIIFSTSGMGRTARWSYAGLSRKRNDRWVCFVRWCQRHARTHK